MNIHNRLCSQKKIIDSTPKLKLVVDKRKQRVVFAGAGKDLEVAFYIMPHHKQSLLKRKYPNRGSNITNPFTLNCLVIHHIFVTPIPLLNVPDLDCTHYDRKVVDDPSMEYPHCHAIMDQRVDFVGVPAGGSAYVNELVKYGVMDDLVVKPMTTDLCVTMLKDKAAMIADEFVDFGVDEGKFAAEGTVTVQDSSNQVFVGKKG